MGITSLKSAFTTPSKPYLFALVSITHNDTLKLTNGAYYTPGARGFMLKV
jgi:hypothetical protein